MAWLLGKRGPGLCLSVDALETPPAAPARPFWSEGKGERGVLILCSKEAWGEAMDFLEDAFKL